jgi:hypothetical protein
MKKTFLALPFLLGMVSCYGPEIVGATKSPTYTPVQHNATADASAQGTSVKTTAASAQSAGPSATGVAGSAPAMTTTPSSAKPPTETMLMTVYEDWAIGGKSQIILTHQDGTQESRFIKWPIPSTVKNLAIREDSLMGAINPFLQQGWTLISATNAGGQDATGVETTRIFFRKQGFQ